MAAYRQVGGHGQQQPGPLRNEWETLASPDSSTSTMSTRRIQGRPRRGPATTAGDSRPTDFRRTTWRVPFGKSLIELALDRGKIESGGRATPICDRTRTDQRRRRRHLRHHHQLQETWIYVPLSPARPSAAMPCSTNTGEAVPRQTAVLGPPCPRSQPSAPSPGCLEQFQRNEYGLVDREARIPNMSIRGRVALRRLRSAIKLFAPVLPPISSPPTTSPGRPWQRGWAKPATGMSSSARRCRRSLPTSPNDGNARRLLAGECGAPSGRGNRRNPRRTAGLFALDRRVHRCPRVAGSAGVEPDKVRPKRLNTAPARPRARRTRIRVDAEERHQMRICFKKLRYASNSFTPCWPRNRLRRYLASLTQIQDDSG